MIAARVLLALAGIWLAAYGISELLDFPPADLKSVALWFAGGILVHDGIFAPLCAAAGVTARRFLPPRRWAPLACGAVCTVTLLLLAVPVTSLDGANSGNPTLRDRPYALGLALALLTVWLLVATVILLQHRVFRQRTLKGEE
ncbi:hypothetical protein [Nocardia huaxiensis]|uniref:hypothetical protein n=1 Tax=Nocardia huaxiensis TaxID=2755382 RepID=UPI001E42639E|nr:hypothetical protein [Nocardia huaxiensis]UFS99194.1 hypothetical protein LPY97_15520 [Nocardia huaxiensis]